MFFYFLRPLVNLKIRQSNLKPSVFYKTLLRHYASQKDCCKPKPPLLLDPDCKTAVVAGGIGGIGFATAQQLLCEKAKKVILLGKDCQAGMEAITCLESCFGKNKAVFFKCDVKDKEELQDTLCKIKTDMKKVDIIVNTTGMWNDYCWQEAMQVNLGGTVNITLAAESCIQKGEGVVVNVTGFQGLEPFAPSPLFAAFASGIINFSRSFGQDVNYKRFGVRVVVLCVGITRTNFLVDVHKRMLTKDMGNDLCEYIKKACSQKPDACAKSILEIIKFAPTGSLWFVEGSRLFLYNAPDYTKSLNLVSRFN